MTGLRRGLLSWRLLRGRLDGADDGAVGRDVEREHERELVQPERERGGDRGGLAVGVVRFVTLKPNAFAMFQPGDGM